MHQKANSNVDIRWLQRFENFEKSLSHLKSGLALTETDIIQKAGIIQFFEMTFELAWKLLKDYLESQGHVDINSPRSALKKAFEVGLIADGHLWLEILEDRNITSHTYDEDSAEQVRLQVRQIYFPLLTTLASTFLEIINKTKIQKLK